MSKRQPETPAEWLEHYEKLRNRNMQNYQLTAEPRYLNAEFKYACICDAFRKAVDHDDEYRSDIKKRMSNCAGVCDRLAKPDYSKEEVIKLLKEAVYW